MHQQRLAGFQSTALERVVPDREDSLRHRRCFDHGEAIDRQRMAFVRESIFGIATTDHQGHDLVADLPTLHVRSYACNLAGDFEARNIGRAGRGRIIALALHDVGPVDAGGRDFHQNLAGARLGHRAHLRHQHVRPARRLDADDGHAGREFGHRFLAIWLRTGLFRRALAV
jgi:hypothetical protein